MLMLFVYFGFFHGFWESIPDIGRLTVSSVWICTSTTGAEEAATYVLPNALVLRRRLSLMEHDFPIIGYIKPRILPHDFKQSVIHRFPVKIPILWAGKSNLIDPFARQNSGGGQG
ncbi:MAG: hypothetical protein M0Q91_15720, partial [Methanoregula sp.]|nr:hypothetical protein [Methanoregula sp.]